MGFVDDEFSTGRTLINMVQQLRERYPRLGERRLAAASILSRVSLENQARLAEAGIACECLVRLEHQDYERMVTGIPVKEAAPPAQGPLPDLRTLYTAEPLPDPRRGVAVGCYTDCCRAAAEELLSRLREELPDQGALLVLGTEECMYPALTVGSLAEQTGLCATVRCHATTRSPIGICPDSAYPIRNGVLLPSFYGGDRKTYLYDLAAYDAALVVTDAPAAVDGTACTRLAAAGLSPTLSLQNLRGSYVQHISKSGCDHPAERHHRPGDAPGHPGAGGQDPERCPLLGDAAPGV